MKSIIPILAFILLVVSACRKEEDAEPKPTPTASPSQYNYISESIAPYKFKTGSYWIYENDSTGLLDSVTVDSISTGFFVSIPSVHGTTGYTYTQFYKMYFHDFGTSELYNQTLMNNYLVRNYSGDYSNFYGQGIYAANSPVGTSSNGMTIIAKFLSMNIGINTFNNVDEVQIIAADQSFPEFAFDTYLYYSDTIGLIKKEAILSPGNIESWSIKRWNVIK